MAFIIDITAGTEIDIAAAEASVCVAAGCVEGEDTMALEIKIT